MAAVFLSTCALGGTPSGELLDFTAKWCGPCQQMGPVVDRLHRQGLPIRKVDIDENRELARKYNIQSIPAFVLVVNGKVVDQTLGLQSEQKLLQMMAKIPKPDPEFDPQHREAPLLVNGQRGNPGVTSAPPWVPANPNQTQRKGLLDWVRSPKQEVANAKMAKGNVARGNIEDKPLDEKEILTRDPMVASTRLRITDKEGTNLGSGTIIDSKVGHTLILTCGHIFRHFQDDSLVEVDVFVGGKKETFVGKRVDHDLELDLGLISISTDNPLPYAQVASGTYQVEKGAAVSSVGCGQGNNPTQQKHLVTQLNRYKGPSNIECTGVPVQGRSGGGLFNQQGQVVGICMAADEKGRRGLYVGLPAIQGFLKTCNLLRLLQNGVSPVVEFEGPDETLLADENADDAQAEKMRPALTGVAALQAALGDDAQDVICVIKSDRNSLSGQRVVVLTGRSAEPVETARRIKRAPLIQTADASE